MKYLILGIVCSPLFSFAQLSGSDLADTVLQNQVQINYNTQLKAPEYEMNGTPFTGVLDFNGEDQSNKLYIHVKNGLEAYYLGKSPQGTTTLITHMKDGVKHGKTELFYLDGTLKEIQQYTKGMPSGVWKTFDSTGKLLEEKQH